MLGESAMWDTPGDSEGVKEGASALSFPVAPAEGMATGGCNLDRSPCDMLIDRPDVEPDGKEGAVPETGEMALRSEIIF